MPKRTCCVWCWAPISVPDDYDDLIYKGVCSDACARQEFLFARAYSNEHYWNAMYENHGLSISGKEKDVPRNPRHTPPKAP